ncbi:MAG TPA: peptide-N4-asparagine amidase, partial [Candidatus Baltobacteraceae bacterium]|nr:peptide-N4-asparagine amidase [Candidatus Baltobacteraceae bacterium]
MNGPFDRRFRLGALALAFGLIATACSGGGKSSGTGVLPGSGTQAAHTLGAIRSAGARIADSEAKAASGGRRAMDFTQPSNTTTADPPVPHPAETPCVVTLFTNYIGGFPVSPNGGQFAYAPPAACPGPWAKVVLSADFSVDAGREFDRTGSIWIAGTNVYFGTTAEPSHNTGPAWHVERDLTDLTAILQAPSTGELVLGNIVNSTYTSNIHVNALIAFYPANATYPAPATPDNVYPLSGGPLGDNQYISTQDQPLTGTFTLPRNVSAAYLDVFLQSQINDEF